MSKNQDIFNSVVNNGDMLSQVFLCFKFSCQYFEINLSTHKSFNYHTQSDEKREYWRTTKYRRTKTKLIITKSQLQSIEFTKTQNAYSYTIKDNQI